MIIANLGHIPARSKGVLTDPILALGMRTELMTTIHRNSIKMLLIAPIISVLLVAPALSADRSEEHALALSHRYGAYTKRGNIAAGQTVVIDTPEGAITCTGGVNRKYTGKNGEEGSLKHDQGIRTCHFN